MLQRYILFSKVQTKISKIKHFQTKKNSASMHIQTKNLYLGYYYYSKKGGCTTEYHNTPTAYIKFILQ